MLRNVIRRDSYYDSVVLMDLSQRLTKLPGVSLAAVMMGTEVNKEILTEAGLLEASGKEAGPNDLIVSIRAEGENVLTMALGVVEELLVQRRAVGHRGERRPRTLEAALRERPDARIALISVPGEYAYLESMKALRRGLHVVLFSDRVPFEAELALKQYALRRGLFVFGPECGTCIINGVPFAFANRVPRGRIGIIGASGTGIQEVSCLLATAGEGISQALGVGGRDLHPTIGGLMMQQAIRALQEDPETAVIIVLAKASSPEIERIVFDLLASGPKSAVVNFLGSTIPRAQGTNRVRVAQTLDEAAVAALGLLRGARGDAPPFAISQQLLSLARALSARLDPSARRIVALYSGGSLVAEAAWLLRQFGEQVTTDLLRGIFPPSPTPPGHLIIDVGEAVYTVGRGHPILDYRIRTDFIRRLNEWRDGGILLLDLILGLGAHPDPASEIIGALNDLPKERRESLVVVASLCGTAADPQGLESQAARLDAAGVTVMPSNAQAIRLAYLVSRGGNGIDPVPRSVHESS